jgi:acetoin utilization protein AcuB
MSTIPQIRSVMTPFPYSIDAGASLPEAQATMAEHDVRHLPVTHGDELVGVVTDRDLKNFLDPTLGIPQLRRVREIMVSDAYIVDLPEPLDNVLLAMARRRIGCALVVRGERLAGIFTTTDATRLLGELYRRLRPPRDDDAA